MYRTNNCTGIYRTTTKKYRHRRISLTCFTSTAMSRTAQRANMDDNNVLQVERCCLDFQIPKELESDVLSSVGTLKGTYLPLCRVDFPQKIYRGIEQRVRICILKRSKNCRPLTNTEPSVNITNTLHASHGSLDVVVTSDDSKSHHSDSWIATFTQAHRGWHQLTIKLGSLNVHSITGTTFEVVSRLKSSVPPKIR